MMEYDVVGAIVKLMGKRRMMRLLLLPCGIHSSTGVGKQTRAWCIL